jgi:hypothetical protein
VSVTFGPEISDADVVTYEVWCDFEDRQIGSLSTYAAAKSLSMFHSGECLHCDGGRIETITDVPLVNVSNCNASLLLTLLKLDHGDLTGSCDAYDFLSRVQRARTSPGYDKESIGYVIFRLDGLQLVGEWCRSNGRQVCWS